MRRTFLLVVVLALLGACSASRASLEDVALLGRILMPNGDPLANRAIYVEAVKPSGLLSGEKTTRFDTTTDAKGRYRFVFKNAHEQGKQTDTDYFLHASLGALRASFELELRDAVHEAPDLKLWEPIFSVTPSGEDYTVSLPEVPGGYTSVAAEADTATLGLYSYGTVAGRDIQDVPVSLVPHAAVDVGANGTTYHQRLTGKPAPFRGSHVPISRGSTCTATARDKSTRPCPGMTNGELTKPGLAKDCCASFVIDLGHVASMDEIDADDCTCSIDVSVDGVTWLDFRFNKPPKPPGRYVRVTGILDPINEVSVWPAA